jgi:hypothetical protein
VPTLATHFGIEDFLSPGEAPLIIQPNFAVHRAAGAGENRVEASGSRRDASRGTLVITERRLFIVGEGTASYLPRDKGLFGQRRIPLFEAIIDPEFAIQETTARRPFLFDYATRPKKFYLGNKKREQDGGSAFHTLINLRLLTDIVRLEGDQGQFMGFSTGKMDVGFVLTTHQQFIWTGDPRYDNNTLFARTWGGTWTPCVMKYLLASWDTAKSNPSVLGSIRDLLISRLSARRDREGEIWAYGRDPSALPAAIPNAPVPGDTSSSPASPRFCTICGGPRNPSASFCGKCGKPFPPA